MILHGLGPHQIGGDVFELIFVNMLTYFLADRIGEKFQDDLD